MTITNNNEEFIRRVTVKQIQKINAYLNLNRKTKLPAEKLAMLEKKKIALKEALATMQKERKISEIDDVLALASTIEKNLNNQVYYCYVCL
jgi:hypothetical protein